MPVNLGGWGWAVKMALDFGAPALGMAFGIPGPVSSFAVNALKKALGLEPSATEEEVKATAQANPEVASAAFQAAQSEVTAKYAYLTRLAEVQADVAKVNVTEVNQTIRAEAGTVSWWHWRSLIGYLVLLYGLVLVGIMFKAAFFPVTGGTAVNDIVNLFNSTTTFTLGLFGLLGYVASDTTDRYKTAITGERGSGGVMNTIRTVATGTRK